VEAIEFFLLPLPAPYQVGRFWVCFRFQLLQNASASTSLPHVFSSKSQMLPSLLPLPASFFKMLLLPRKLNRFHFHILASNYAFAFQLVFENYLNSVTSISWLWCISASLPELQEISCSHFASFYIASIFWSNSKYSTCCFGVAYQNRLQYQL